MPEIYPLNGKPGAWIGRDPSDITEVNPTPAEEDRPDLTLALHPPTCLRIEFEAHAGAARLTATALGVYRIHLNGTRIGDEWLAPGWTDYAQRVHEQEYQVGGLLREGTNVLAAVLADGWYSGYVGFDRGHQARLYGDTPQLSAHLADSDGKTLVATGPGWKRSSGRYMYADLQMGEMQSGLREPHGWMLPGFDDAHWADAHVTERKVDDPRVEPSPAPPIRCTREIEPVTVATRADGRTVVDFGQNLVGVIRLTLRGTTPGARVHVRHAETLTPDGEPYFENLRTALAHDIYECAGGDETFEPHFTFHGFRYAEITGNSTPVRPEDVAALVLHSDVARVGFLETGDPEVNRLHENIDWTIRGNLLDVPTDCPQRDERLGWLGDAGLIMPTALWLRDLDGFLAKWTQDIRDAQSPEGAYPDVAPLANLRVAGAPGWADAGATVPWMSYLYSGTRRHLEANYPAMRRWIDYLVQANPSLVRTAALGRNYGDWLNLDDPTPKPLLATAYFASSVESVAKTAAALGHDTDAHDYRRLLDEIRAAFQREFVGLAGQLAGDSQTAYAMALHLDLLAPEVRDGAAGRLVDSIRERRHLTTGIHGTRFLCPALSDTGHDNIAYDLLLRGEFPSWLYQVRSGATTIWERWDGWTPERGFQTPRMNSLNHYALGSIGEWLHRYVAGVNPVTDRPAFEHVLVRPHPSHRLGYARARRATSRGPLEVAWFIEDDRLRLEVSVPEGATASIWMPTTEIDGWSVHEVTAGNHVYESAMSPEWRASATLSPDRIVRIN